MAYLEASVRRRQMIDAARTALAEHGVARTSLRVVASTAGVPLGTLQYVFPSKDELLRAVIEDVVTEISDVLAEAATTDQGLEEAIRSGLTHFWSTLVEGHTGLQLVQYELVAHALRTEGQDDLARRQYDRYAEVAATWCTRAAEASGEPLAVPADQLGRLLVAGIDGLILQHVSRPDPARSAADLALLIDAVISVTRRTS